MSQRDPSVLRIRTGHGKPGKSWNLRISFPGLESHGILLLVLESHGKVKVRFDRLFTADEKARTM